MMIFRNHGDDNSIVKPDINYNNKIELILMNIIRRKHMDKTIKEILSDPLAMMADVLIGIITGYMDIDCFIKKTSNVGITYRVSCKIQYISSGPIIWSHRTYIQNMPLIPISENLLLAFTKEYENSFTVVLFCCKYILFYNNHDMEGIHRIAIANDLYKRHDGILNIFNKQKNKYVIKDYANDKYIMDNGAYIC